MGNDPALKIWSEGADAPPILLLHGFSGHGEGWADLAPHLGGDRTVASLTLPGHDPAFPIHAESGFEEILDEIRARLLGTIDHGSHVLGYSMGGRIALGLLLRHPDLFSKAWLVGVNPGIERDTDRAERAGWDTRWADLIEREDVEAFVAEWERLPLFASQSSLPAEIRRKDRERRLAHSAQGLAAAMRILGLSAMPNYWAGLPSVGIPVHLIVGELDSKFRKIAARAVDLLPHGEMTVVQAAGHNVVLERPEVVAELVGRA